MVMGEGEVAVLKSEVGVHVVTEKISGPINRTNHCGGNSCLNLTIFISSCGIGQCDFYFSFKSHCSGDSCCWLVRILYFYSSYKIDFKFWKSLRTDGYIKRVLVNDMTEVN